jgi:hypothetical protein
MKFEWYELAREELRVDAVGAPCEDGARVGGWRLTEGLSDSHRLDAPVLALRLREVSAATGASEVVALSPPARDWR